jgi:uncharacterized hydrophobic protein (TIGR00271 family)
MESMPSRQLLRREFEAEARCDQEFLVQSVAATLIASLGLLANSAAVVIGAMLVAPWILPLRAAAYAVLRGQLALVGRALLTLAIGAVSTFALAALLGRLVGLPIFGSEVIARTSPNLLDLGIALVAGAIAAYAKVRRKAVSALAGTAIAVALVPPVCTSGLLAAAGQWALAGGAALLFLTNLLGILSGALITLGLSRPELAVGWRRRRLSLGSLVLTSLLLLPLSGSFLNLLRQARRTAVQEQVEQAIDTSLRKETITLGQNADLVGIRIDWAQNPPLIRAMVRVSRPDLPTPKQVEAVQSFINSRQPIRFRLLVQRSLVDVVGPPSAPNPPDPDLPLAPSAPATPAPTPPAPTPQAPTPQPAADAPEPPAWPEQPDPDQPLQPAAAPPR